MAYKNIVFIKLEKRLLNDHRWYMMSAKSQLIYIKLILLAAETYNKIPKNDHVLREALRSRLELSDFKNCLKEIRIHFPKFKENRYFRYFYDFESKTNYISPQQKLSNSPAIAEQGVEKEKEKEKDKEKEKRKRKTENFTPPSLDELRSFCLKNKFGLNCEVFINYYSSNGWMVGRNKMKSWRATVRSWVSRDKEGGGEPESPQAKEFRRKYLKGD